MGKINYNSEIREQAVKLVLKVNFLNNFRKAEAPDIFKQNDSYECCKIFQPNSIKVSLGQLELNALAGLVSICGVDDVFVERLKKAAMKAVYGFGKGLVNYYDLSKDNISDEYPKNAFRKRSEFSYQREFRFLSRKKGRY